MLEDAGAVALALAPREVNGEVVALVMALVLGCPAVDAEGVLSHAPYLSWHPKPQ